MARVLMVASEAVDVVGDAIDNNATRFARQDMVEQAWRIVDPILGGGVKEVAPFVFLVVILMIKPYGLFGLVKIERL